MRIKVGGRWPLRRAGLLLGLVLLLGAALPAMAQTGNPTHDALQARTDLERRQAMLQALRGQGDSCNIVILAYHAGSDADRVSYWDMRCGDGSTYRARLPAERFAGAAFLRCGAAAAPPQGGPCFQPVAVALDQATAEAGLDALANRQIDLLARNTTATMSRDSGCPVTAGPIIYYDGMAFLVSRTMGISSPRQLGGRTVCWAGAEGAQGGAEDNLAGFQRRHSINWTVRRFDTQPQVIAAMINGECQAFAADAGALAARRVTDFQDPSRWIVLPEIISSEPLTPWIRANDEAWRDLIFWAAQALIEAEAFGITSQNLTQNLTHPDWRVRRLLGMESDLGRGFNLPNTWAARMIAAVGNYGEIFDRNLSRQSIIGMDRGLNDQWTRGGLLYAIPTR